MMSLADHSMSQSYVATRVILPQCTGIQSGLEWEKMFSEVSAHLTRRADLLMAGRVGDLLSDFHYPLPLFLLTDRVILRSAEEVISVLHLVRDELLARHVTRLVPTVSAVDIPRAGRFRTWVTWHEMTVNPADSRSSDVIYFCKKSAHGLRMEMVCYTRLSMPEISPKFAELALSA
jgi:hypothetical protein